MSDKEVWDETIVTAAKSIAMVLRGLPEDAKDTIMKVVDALLDHKP